MEHPDDAVRRVAVHALAEVAERGHAAAIEALVRCSEDPDEDVRRAAVDALGQVAEEKNTLAIEAVARRLEDVADVRRASVHAFTRISGKAATLHTSQATDDVVDALLAPELKDSVAERSNHSNLCRSEFGENSVRIQDIYQNSSEILRFSGVLNIFKNI